MTTTINNHSKRSHIEETARSPGAGYLGKSWGQIRASSIACDLDGATQEEPKTASPAVAFVSGAKAIMPVSLALIPFAVAFGATAMGSGLSTLEALAMSVFVFAGAAQLAAIPLISAGASVAVVVLTVLVINLRLTLYSASLAPHFRRLPAGWKGLLSYLLTDQAYAATITRFDDGRTEEPDKRWYYLGVALAIWVTWQAATMLGVFLGSWASEGWSLDFVLPLIFIALALPAIKDRSTTAAALSAGGTAVFAAAMPLNIGLITAALVGVLGGLVAESVAERRRR
jgi:4-azaleucine resistance transporter AzlC